MTTIYDQYMESRPRWGKRKYSTNVWTGADETQWLITLGVHFYGEQLLARNLDNGQLEVCKGYIEDGETLVSVAKEMGISVRKARDILYSIDDVIKPLVEGKGFFTL